MSELLFKRQMLAGLEGLTLPQNICPQTDCVSFIISFYAVGCVSFHAGTPVYQFGHTYNNLSTHYLQYLSYMYIHKQPGLFKFKVCGSKDVVSHRIPCKGFFLTF